MSLVKALSQGTFRKIASTSNSQIANLGLGEGQSALLEVQKGAGGLALTKSVATARVLAASPQSQNARQAMQKKLGDAVGEARYYTMMAPIVTAALKDVVKGSEDRGKMLEAVQKAGNSMAVGSAERQARMGLGHVQAQTQVTMAERMYGAFVL